MNFLVNDAPRTSDVQPEVQTPQMICKNCKFCNKYWNDSKKCFAKMKDKYSADKKMWNASRFCVSSLRRGHANLLCIVPILVYVLPKQYVQ